MCHLILMLPVVALPVFWLLPLTVAAPVYGTASALAGVVYYFAWETGRRPVAIGRERLVGMTARVLETEPSLRVELDGETWRALSPETLAAGDVVHIHAVRDLTLHVRHAASPPPVAAESRTEQWKD